MRPFQDQHFLQELNLGNEQAFLKVYDFFAPKIFRYIYYKTGRNKELAADLTQQTFFKTWEYIESKDRDIANIQPFLYRIARNLVVDLWRSKEKASLPLLDELVETTETDPRWQEKIEAKVSVEKLQESMEQIHESYRDVLVMRYLQELEIDEIAEVLEKDKNNVYVLIHRATQSLRKVIGDNQTSRK